MNAITKTSALTLALVSATFHFLASSSIHAAEGNPEATVINISTLPGLRYDTTEFSVRPNTEVELIFTNADEMLHNLVITTPGSRMEIVNAALMLGADGPDKDYVPDSPKVLWNTKVLQADEEFTLKFTSPESLGDYPYVCTFPGHGLIMFGNMKVTRTPQPPVRNTGIVAMATGSDEHATSHSDMAIVKRMFMPDAGPATIAVGLPNDFSYCWDAGAVRFRYAWQGGFAEEIYRQPMRLQGDVFYREETAYPIRIGSDPKSVPEKIQFGGYGFDAMGIPEFEYTVDGVQVFERIEARDGNLVRRFRTDATDQPIWFAVPTESDSMITATGVKEGDFYKFNGPDAKEFYVTINADASHSHE